MVVHRFLFFRDQRDALVRASFHSLCNGKLDRWATTPYSECRNLNLTLYNLLH